MKRNIFIVLTLALVCVLFVACGKEETPVDVAIGELQAARENIDNQIAALEAQRPDDAKGSGTTAVHLAAAGQPTPVEKTREEMTEEEREAYDKAKISEFAKSISGDPMYAHEVLGKIAENRAGEKNEFPGLMLCSIDKTHVALLYMPECWEQADFPTIGTPDDRILYKEFIDNPIAVVETQSSVNDGIAG